MKILEYPNPSLTKKTKKVVRFGPRFGKIFRDMVDTATKADGLGLASPQVGSNESFFIALDGKEYRLFINPKLIYKSTEVYTSIEGCLSLPGRAFEVARHSHIKVEFQTDSGRKTQLEAKDLLAACIQHEMDHLLGLTLEETGNEVDAKEHIGLLV